MTVHFILSGETLESIAEEINLENPKYLKEFHNTHCAREDFIYDDLVPRKKLLIPDIQKIKEYNSRNDADFKDPKLNPHIPFRPENLAKIYTVESRETEENVLEEKENALSYTVSVKWIRKEENNHIFHLFKNNFSEKSGSMMADLASESIRSLNPVEVKTDDKGRIVLIALPKETLDNLTKIKERLEDLFPDKYAKIYLDEFERIVLDPSLFYSRIKDDIFIKNYFADLRNSFTKGKSYLTQSIGEENTEIQLLQQVENADYDREIILQQRINPLENNKDFKGKYVLFTESGLVKEIEIKYTISQFGVKNTSLFVLKELS
ncbi:MULTISPECIES: hypothetical protein [Chryseobacterium]|uniref:LysM domain-containing protein n=1 Tax=Candidatus Chryseobacterium massiliense TaxID=204089 RepID=A0A3D9AW84_9FLAO|nr:MULTISPECIES: hypothetical protein [Chryseobacterium]REC45525.1 hypothetical protein DRF68_15475 [Candidatus Chryseobacterium massiliae]